jgi:hypothetical protein
VPDRWSLHSPSGTRAWPLPAACSSRMRQSRANCEDASSRTGRLGYAARRVGAHPVIILSIIDCHSVVGSATARHLSHQMRRATGQYWDCPCRGAKPTSVQYHSNRNPRPVSPLARYSRVVSPQPGSAGLRGPPGPLGAALAARSPTGRNGYVNGLARPCAFMLRGKVQWPGRSRCLGDRGAPARPHLARRGHTPEVSVRCGRSRCISS